MLSEVHNLLIQAKAGLDYLSSSLQSLQILGTVLLGGLVLLIRRFRRRGERKPCPSRRELVSHALVKIRGQATLTRTGITLGRLADDPNIWAEPRLRFLERPSAFRLDHSPDIESLRSALEDSSVERICILAPAGFGKSTILKRLFCEFAQRYVDGSVKVYPIFIDFGEEIENSDFEQMLKRRNVGEPTLFFLDGLDEALSAGRRSFLNRMIARIEPQDSALIGSRRPGYSGFLANSSLAITAVIEIAGYADDVLTIHARNLITKVWQEGNAAQASALIMPAITHGILNTPLHVALALQGSMIGDHRKARVISSISEVYGTYIDTTIDRECSKPGCPTSASEIRRILDRLAFLIVTQQKSGRTLVTAAAVINLPTVRRAVSDVLESDRIRDDFGSIIEWLIVRSVLEPTSTVDAGWTFIHPSILDYLVANCVLAALVSQATDVPPLLHINLPQEVYEFLKVMIDGASPSIGRSICMTVEEVLAGIDRNSWHEAPTSIMLEQLGHILGHVGLDRASHLASSIAVTFPSAFIVRGVAIGLAFGGTEAPLRDYVTGLERELEEHGVGTMNLVNLRHQLAYFGDLDELSVDEPGLRGVDAATFTVKKLCEQLSSRVHGPSWLLDLYTLRVVIHLDHTGRVNIADRSLNVGKTIEAGRKHLESVDVLVAAQAGKLIDEAETWRIECAASS